MVSMSDEIIFIFAECMEAIEEGRLTIAECLVRYPQYRAELSDLLSVATEIRAVPVVRPTLEVRQRSHAQLMAQLSAPEASALAGQMMSPDPTFALGISAAVIPFLTWLRQAPERVVQKWPTLTKPALSLGISAVGALFLLLSIGLFTAVGANFVQWLKQPAEVNTVSIEAVLGVVEVLGTDGKWTPVSKPIVVTADSRIRTGENSGAEIIFSDGRVAVLGSNSEVSISQLSPPGLGPGPTITGTVTPTSTPSPAITPTPPITPTLPGTGMVTLCHKPGTPAEKTMTLPLSALGGHLIHGDTLGACLGATPTITPTMTISPTVTITPTGTVTVTPTVTPTSGSMVTLCHKPGTPAEQTMTLPASAVDGHLGHGDILGPCPEATSPAPPPGPTAPPPPSPGNGGNNMVTICHKPGTPAEQTMTVPESALAGHLGHGDTMGACP
jgi:hypothetical protein